MKTLLLAGLIAGANTLALASAALTESTFTEIIHEAKVVAASDKTAVPARTGMVFHAPDKVRTGMASRVEMTAPDKTITRIGANTVFTFETGGRNIALEAGSLLFHSPAGAGGGTIHYRGTAAAVLGTTMICAVLSDGRFKVLDLEGKVKVTLKKGRSIFLKAGQMVIVTPDGDEFEDIKNFNLGKLVSHLVLVTGFSDPLSSLPLIQAAIDEQNHDIANGTPDPPVSDDEAGFGVDTRDHDHFGPVLPPETPDHTMLHVSPVKPKKHPPKP